MNDSLILRIPHRNCRSTRGGLAMAKPSLHLERAGSSGGRPGSFSKHDECPDTKFPGLWETKLLSVMARRGRSVCDVGKIVGWGRLPSLQSLGLPRRTMLKVRRSLSTKQKGVSTVIKVNRRVLARAACTIAALFLITELGIDIAFARGGGGGGGGGRGGGGGG